MTVANLAAGHNRHRLRYLPRILALMWRVNRTAVLLIAFLSISMGLLAAAEVHLLRQLVGSVQEVVAGNAPIIAGMLWGGALGGLAFLIAAARALHSLVAARHQETLRRYIEGRCYWQGQHMPLEQFERPEHYDGLARARQGIEHRLFSTHRFFWESVSSIVALAAIGTYLGQFHWGLPIIVASGTTLGVFGLARHSRKQYLLARQQTPQQRRHAMLGRVLTSREAASEIRLFGFGEWLIEQAEHVWHRLTKERLQLAGTEARVTSLSDGLNVLAYVATIVFGIWLLTTGQAGVDAYAAFFLAIETFQSRYQQVALRVSGTLYNDLLYIRDFLEFVDGPRLDLDKGRRQRDPIMQGIVFDDVSFTYPGSEQSALSDLDLTIQPGQRLALVGENGAGKTTLVKLLMGLYRPTSGRILVDGVELQELAPNDWCRRFGTIFQDFLRYQTTVRENINFGWVEGAGNELALLAAATRSGSDEVIATLPDGWDTLLGREFHDGTELSVGQWQKLAIARAYFRPAEILIMDEPAAALDAKAEAAVYEHFARMAEDRTVVMISHRLGSCQLADRILVLHQGRLVEEGTHSELVAAGGEYANLYELQAGWYR